MTSNLSLSHGARALGAAALLVFAGGTGAATAAERPLSLAETVARALEADEAILVERATLRAADAGVLGARGAYDTVLGLEAGWSESTDPLVSSFSGAPAGRLSPTYERTATGAGVRRLLPTGAEVSLSATTGRLTSDSAFDLLSPSYETRLGFEVRQPLLRDRGIDAARTGLRVAAAEHGRAAAGLRTQVIETVAAAERAYWSLAAARREIAVREEAVALAEEQLAQTELRIASGITPETELAQPRAELERRRGDLFAARERVARAETALKLLVLADADTDLWADRLIPADDAPVAAVPVDVTAALAAALAHRPEIAAARAVVGRREAEAVLAADAVRPGLDLVLGYDRYGLAGSLTSVEDPAVGRLDGSLGSSFEALGDGDFEDARVALVFELPLGNRRARAEVEIAESARLRAEAAVAGVRKAIRSEVLDAAAAVETAAARIEAARAAREAAEVQLAAERERYAAGLSTNFLVLTRQNDLASARLAEISALTDYRVARTELARASGTILDERSISIESI